ncbi:MAG: CRISPR-associated helicase Cas3', partial [Balneolales bacterium]
MKGIPDDFWAKLDRNEDGAVTHWHPLIAHSADVAAVVEALLMRTILNRRLARLLGQEKLTDIQIARFAALSVIHDAGKANHGFQNQAFDIKGPREGHVGPIIEIIQADENFHEQLLIPLGIQDVLTWFSNQETAVHFLFATWAHHGKPVLPRSNFKQSLWEKNTRRDPVEALSSLSTCMKQWFPDAFKEDSNTIPDQPVIQHIYNGILTLADWLGSDTRFFSFTESLENYIQRARDNAGKAIRALTLDAGIPREIIKDSPISFRMFSPWEPFEIQKQCLELPTFSEGSLTILESDTGSGKTEAALSRFLKLYQEGLVDGMYFAVPTRSAATQLYDRVEKAVEKAFGEHKNRPPVVQAVSGYLKVDAVEGTALPHFKVLWYDDRKDELRERSWAAEHPKRYLAGAVVVGTIDQVLLATLQVKHAHMRTAALLRHFLVVDEVHSSDVYMTRLLERVLDLHLSAGGHALLMSATLGTSSRYRFAMKKKEPVPEAEKAEMVAYPLLTHTNQMREKTFEITGKSSGFQKNIRAETKNIAGYPDKIAELALEKAGSGARVLIIRNKVSDCIETQKAIEEIAGTDSGILFKSDGIPAPHHSQFAAEDRKQLDLEIESYFGKSAGRDSVIAVATQTVEQSLDIDADFMISDLCPMDVLLQRIGRLHRHQRPRPKGFETAQCVVLTPEDRDLGQFISKDGQARKGKFGLGTVYQDLRILEKTWQVLEDVALSGWKIP